MGVRGERIARTASPIFIDAAAAAALGPGGWGRRAWFARVLRVVVFAVPVFWVRDARRSSLGRLSVLVAVVALRVAKGGRRFVVAVVPAVGGGFRLRENVAGGRVPLLE